MTISTPSRVRHTVRSLEGWSGSLAAENVWIDRFKLSIPSIGLAVECGESQFLRYLEGRRALFPHDVEIDRRRAGLLHLEGWSGSLAAENVWIDRFKLSIPSIGLAVECGESQFLRYLEGRRALFPHDVEIDRRRAGLLHLAFPATSWLFRCQMKWKFLSGRWIGAASIEGNSTRLLASVGRYTDLRGRDCFGLSELSTSRIVRSEAYTLDGNDNFVPEELLRQACNIQWPRLTHVYVDSIKNALNELLGFTSDLRAGGGPQMWLLQTAPPSAWVVKEVEFYHEFAETNAPLRVAEMVEISRSLSSVFCVNNHGPAVFGERREENSPAMQLGLGRKGVYLSVYAKTFERLRMEVRYKQGPCKASGLTRSDYLSPDVWLNDLLCDMRRDAVGRMNAYLAGYNKQRGRTTTLLSLAICLPKIATACLGNEMLTHRVLSLLIINGGLTRSGNDAFDAVIDKLVASGILHRVRTTTRGDLRIHALKPRFRGAIQALKSLPAVNQSISSPSI